MKDQFDFLLYIVVVLLIMISAMTLEALSACRAA